MGITNLISEQIHASVDIDKKQKLMGLARKSLIDYLASIELSKNQPAVVSLANQLSTSIERLPLTSQLDAVPIERAALINGFGSHYLDYDDVQANLRGHPSAVIFSALFAAAHDDDTVEQILWSYIEGVEFAGKLGKQIQPAHTNAGWHSTGTVGTLAAAAAISVLRKLSIQETTDIISIASSQASGMRYQFGTDTKPLHAGLAARNAVTAYLIVKAGLSTNEEPLNNDNGWAKTLHDIEITKEVYTNWLLPAEIESPGIWYKQHQFCSAAISSYDAAKQLTTQGFDLENVDKIIIHFPKGGDKALIYRIPETGQQGKFSPEYIIWQVFTHGDVYQKDFDDNPIDEEFKLASDKFERKNDLPQTDVNARPVILEYVSNTHNEKIRVDYPKGSPNNPLTSNELFNKLESSFTTKAKALIEVINRRNALITEVNQIINN